MGESQDLYGIYKEKHGKTMGKRGKTMRIYGKTWQNNGNIEYMGLKKPTIMPEIVIECDKSR